MFNFYKYSNFCKKNTISIIVYLKKIQNMPIYRYLFWIVAKVILKYFLMLQILYQNIKNCKIYLCKFLKFFKPILAINI